MPQVQFHTEKFRAYVNNLKNLYGDGTVNRWIRRSFAKKVRTPNALIKALKAVTPRRRRRGGLRTTVNSEVFRRYPIGGRQEPVLFVGGTLARGGFVYNFLRGTRQRKTKKGQNRGKIRDLRLGERASRIGLRRSLLRFTNNLAVLVNVEVRKIQGKVRAAPSRSSRGNLR